MDGVVRSKGKGECEGCEKMGEDGGGIAKKVCRTTRPIQSGVVDANGSTMRWEKDKQNSSTALKSS